MLNAKKSALLENINHYADHHNFVTILILHTFITAFFLLWNGAADIFGVELVISKFLHCIFPLIALHWRVLSNYSIFKQQIKFNPTSIKRYYHNNNNNSSNLTFTLSDYGPTKQGKAEEEIEEEKIIRKEEYESEYTKTITAQDYIIYRTKVKITILFLILIIVDILFVCIKLLPIGITCVNRWDTGEKIPVECGGRDRNQEKLMNYHSDKNGEINQDVRNIEHGTTNLKPQALYIVTLLMSLIHVVVSIRTIYLVWRKTLMINAKNL